MNHGKDGIVLQSRSVVVWDQGALASHLCALVWEAEEQATRLGALNIPSQLESNLMLTWNWQAPLVLDFYCDVMLRSYKVSVCPGGNHVAQHSQLPWYCFYLFFIFIFFEMSLCCPGWPPIPVLKGSSYSRLRGSEATGPHCLNAMFSTAEHCFPETLCLM